MFLFHSFALASLILVVESAHDPLNYDFSTSLHSKYTLHWNNPNNGRLCMAVEVETLGWVGLGFSPNGGMIGSDIMMAWVIDGKATITDRYAERESLPVSDVQQDFQLMEGYEENGKTVIEFCRNLQTCDTRDRDISSGTIRIIYSWNGQDPINDIPAQHTTRGTQSVNLLNKGNRGFSQSLPANTKTLSFTAGNITIPNKETTYWCTSFRFPHPAVKHHVVRISITVDPRTTKYVHHALMYSCKGHYPEVSGECFSGSGPIAESGLELCTAITIASWAVGGTDLEFPLEAGLPIGGSKLNFDTVLLEMHYDNPDRDMNQIDDSGFIFHYTETLRQNDAASLSIGHTVGEEIAIPPKSTRFLVQGYCPSVCTQNYLTQDINVFASFLHSHLVGVSMWTQLIRDKKEIGYLDMNLNYDFDYQEPLYNYPPIIVKPGDELILNCLYSTPMRNNFTSGGLSTRQEMCQNYFYYYPKQDFPLCLTTYRTETMFKAALDAFQCNNVPVSDSMSRDELFLNADNIQWTDKIIRTLEVSQTVDDGNVYVYCDPSGNYTYEGQYLFNVSFPKPGVDYEVFQHRYDTCGNYNGTYYPGGNGDYYYDCNTNKPFFTPITATGAAIQTLPMAFLMVCLAIVLSLLGN